MNAPGWQPIPTWTQPGSTSVERAAAVMVQDRYVWSAMAYNLARRLEAAGLLRENSEDASS